MDMARDAEAGTVSAPRWYTADRQTEGRGRRGREWTSPVGNLNATAGFTTSVPAEGLAAVCLVGGVALFEAIDDTAQGAGISLKWPNDILLDDRKLAGVLVETAMRPGTTRVLVGFGVNLVPVTRTDRAVAWLSDVTSEILLERLDAALAKWLSIWEREGFAPIRGAWELAGPPAGTDLTLSDGAVRGKYEGLGPSGELRLQTAHGLELIGQGELC